MALTIQADTEGQLPAAKGTLYTCPAVTTAVVKSFQFTNVTGGALTMNFYKKRATSRSLCPLNLSLAAGETLLSEDGDEIFLEAGDLLEGDASAATSIDYTISILERT